MLELDLEQEKLF